MISSLLNHEPPRVLFVGKFAEEVLEDCRGVLASRFSIEQVRGRDADFMRALSSADAVVTRSGYTFDRALVGNAPRLTLIIAAAAGIDMIDSAACEERGIAVKSVPGENAQSVAELTICFMGALARHLPYVHEGMREGKWMKDEPEGRELSGKRIAVLGYGNVGRRVARLLRPYECEIAVFDPVLFTEAGAQFDVSVLALARDAFEAVREADFILLHLPFVPETEGMVNEEFLRRCKRGVAIVNVSRGGIMEKEAVLKGLRDGVIGGLAIDTWWEEPPEKNEFVEFPNVIMTPHIGANTTEAVDRVTRAALGIVREFFKIS